MSEKKNQIIITLVISVVWGYFADLKHGEIGFFFGRIIFMVLFVSISDKIIFSKLSGK